MIYLLVALVGFACYVLIGLAITIILMSIGRSKTDLYDFLINVFSLPVLLVLVFIIAIICLSFAIFDDFENYTDCCFSSPTKK